MPTLLLVVAAAMIAKVAFADGAPDPAMPRRPEVADVAAPSTPTAPVAPTRARAVEQPPACDTPVPSEVCRTGLPACPAVLATPDVLCRWPGDPGAPPH